MIYVFPFAMDIVVSLLLFVGRHSLASIGAGEAMVGSIPLIYGVGYVLAGPLMRAVISRRHARGQMIIAMIALAGLSVLLANQCNLLVIQVLFCIVPFGVALFFNAFQAFMLGLSNDVARPLALTVAIYTVAWSLGFALGPFVCGIMKNYFSWSQTYYFAAMISGAMLILVLVLRPGSARAPAETGGAPPATRKPQLFVPGWMGVFIGLVGWLVIATYWPVIAEAKGISSNVKGLVEFSYAVAQAIGALLLIGLGDWHHNPWFLPFFALLAVAALLIFGMAQTAPLFIAGAALMGLFTATTFIFSVYHCMLDTRQASKRVAMNEMTVGFGYVCAPALAALLHRPGTPFFSSFAMTAGVVVVMVAVQTTTALRLGRRTAPEKSR